MCSERRAKTSRSHCQAPMKSGRKTGPTPLSPSGRGKEFGVAWAWPRGGPHPLSPIPPHLRLPLVRSAANEHSDRGPTPSLTLQLLPKLGEFLERSFF